MQITTTQQAYKPLAAAKTVAPQTSQATESVPAESFSRSSEALPALYSRDASSRNIGGKVAGGIAGAVIGGGLAAWAVSSGGVFGGIIGAVALAAPAAAIGFMGGGIVADRTGNRDASDVIGGALLGGFGGTAAGLTAGALIGSSGSTGALVALSAAGAISGGYFGAMLDLG